MFYGKVKGRGYISKIIDTKRWAYKQGENGTNYIYTYKLTFKRNHNDVDGDCCFKTEAELFDYVNELKDDPKLDEKTKSDLDKFIVEEHSTVPIKKRFLVSMLKHKFKDLRISKAKGDCCGTCGWTISYDEPYLQFQGLQICIHCMKEFYDISKPHLDVLDEAYHDTWLMERVTKEL